MKSVSVGAFYHPHLASTILEHADEIDHLAMADPPDPRDAAFPRIAERFTLLLHDYLGQLSEPIEGEALERAKALAARYRTPWAMEHLQRVRSTDGSARIDYVFPPLYTEDLLADYVKNARALQAALGVPLAVEPIPDYLGVELPGAMPEAAFVRRFLDESGCLLLLDVAHVWLSAHFAGRQPTDLLDEYPLDRIVEIHVGGLEPDLMLEDRWIGAAVPDAEQLDLAERAAARAPALRALTFDAFATRLDAETLLGGVRAIRERFGSAR
jgi:hypothetical protein